MLYKIPGLQLNNLKLYLTANIQKMNLFLILIYKYSKCFYNVILDFITNVSTLSFKNQTENV